MTLIATPIAQNAALRTAARRRLSRKHRLMLLAAFELVVFGFAQAAERPYRRAILIEVPEVAAHRIA